jgi:putative membrane protein
MYGIWNNWYSGFGWVLWFGFVFLLLSSFGNWGYTYRAHRRFDGTYGSKNAVDYLNERYAKGELSQEEYNRIKDEIDENKIDRAKAA